MGSTLSNTLLTAAIQYHCDALAGQQLLRDQPLSELQHYTNAYSYQLRHVSAPLACTPTPNRVSHALPTSQLGDHLGHHRGIPAVTMPVTSG